MQPDKLLHRIQALMAKANDPATTEPEADLYHAKAAELMARHGIDAAMLGAANPGRDDLADQVVTPPAPFSREKALFLAAVADAMGGRGVVSRLAGNVWAAHLFGYRSDLDRITLMVDLLLTQLSLRLAALHIPAGINSRSYRRAFIGGWRSAVLQRIHAAEHKARRDADQPRSDAAPSVAVVLADRSRAVAAHLAATYPRLRTISTRYQSHGFTAGQQAGQNADLGGPRLRGNRGGGNALPS